MQNLDGLSEAGRIAYQAFLDMHVSKAAHIACLQALENRYQAGGAPSAAENRELEKLLADHDKNVLAFKTAMDAVTDPDEMQALMGLMS